MNSLNLYIMYIMCIFKEWKNPISFIIIFMIFIFISFNLDNKRKFYFSFVGVSLLFSVWLICAWLSGRGHRRGGSDEVGQIRYQLSSSPVFVNAPAININTTTPPSMHHVSTFPGSLTTRDNLPHPIRSISYQPPPTERVHPHGARAASWTSDIAVLPDTTQNQPIPPVPSTNHTPGALVPSPDQYRAQRTIYISSNSVVVLTWSHENIFFLPYACIFCQFSIVEALFWVFPFYIHPTHIR